MADSDNDNKHSWLQGGGTQSDKIAEQYDRWAETYDTDLQKWQYRAPSEAAKLLRPRVGLSASILDAGCGTGLTGKALKDLGYSNITGIDISAHSLRLAEQTGVYNNLKQHDLQIQPLPFEDAAFTSLICVGVLTYIEHPQALLEEFCRLVQPDGHLVFTHREDLARKQKFREILTDIETQGYWQKLEVSTPQLYLPNNEDFGDKITIVYYSYRVGSK